jgi:GTPase SAR1 family protein
VGGFTNAQVVGGREELSALLEFLEGVDRLSCALLLAGEAGAGKTTLLEAGVTAARDRKYSRPMPELHFSCPLMRSVRTYSRGPPRSHW